MAKFLMVYYGGTTASNPKEMEKSNMEWNSWFKSMGKGLADMGAPTMGISGKMVTSGGVKAVSGEPVTGYTVIMADNMDDAVKMAKGAPGMDKGLKVAVYPIMDMMAPAKK